MFCGELHTDYGKPLATTRLKGYMGSYIWTWAPLTFQKNCVGHSFLTPKSPGLPNAPMRISIRRLPTTGKNGFCLLSYI